MKLIICYTCILYVYIYSGGSLLCNFLELVSCICLLSYIIYNLSLFLYLLVTCSYIFTHSYVCNFIEIRTVMGPVKY